MPSAQATGDNIQITGDFGRGTTLTVKKALDVMVDVAIVAVSHLKFNNTDTLDLLNYSLPLRELTPIEALELAHEILGAALVVLRGRDEPVTATHDVGGEG